MAIRFKFRSSVNFDSIDIDDRPSISIRDLKSMIVRHKHLDLSEGFDLVFCDALTGQEYTDANFQIPRGSSVIIKRVPAGSVPSEKAPQMDMFESTRVKEPKIVNSSRPMSTEMDAFDDFGVDLYSVPKATSRSILHTDKKTFTCTNSTNVDIARCSETPEGGCTKLESSDLSEAIPEGDPAYVGIPEKAVQTKTKLEPDKGVELENPPVIRTFELPSELKCSLCDSYFKEAVMLPCCQHSFCEKCIRPVLLEKAKCPKCLSTKYRVKNLLPNVSLRQAIEHFLESRILISGLVNNFERYAPDGESGIQAKDVSCSLSVCQRESDHSPSLTGRGSNHVVAESSLDSLFRKKKSINGIHSRMSNLGVNNSLKSPPVDMAAFDDCEGESQPFNEKATHIFNKKKGLWGDDAGRDQAFMGTGRHKKGHHRTCYMCGSPYHFIKDCPAAPDPQPTLQIRHAMVTGTLPGYSLPYWNGNAWPHVRPFGNPYDSPSIIPYNAHMVSAPAFPVPSYMPSMCGGLPVSGGFMRTDGMAIPPQVKRNEFALRHSEIQDIHNCEKRQKLSNEDLRRDISFDKEDEDTFDQYQHNQDRRSHEYRYTNREISVGLSEDSCSQRSHRKHQHTNHGEREATWVVEELSEPSRSDRDERLYRSRPERSSSEVPEFPSSSNSKERHRHHHRSSRKHDERREKCSSDYSRSPHKTGQLKEVKRKRVESDVRSHKELQSHPDPDLERSVSVGQRMRRKETSYNSRRSRHNVKSRAVESSHDRWQMISGSDEYGKESSRKYKRKKVS